MRKKKKPYLALVNWWWSQALTVRTSNNRPNRR